MKVKALATNNDAVSFCEAARREVVEGGWVEGGGRKIINIH